VGRFPAHEPGRGQCDIILSVSQVFNLISYTKVGNFISYGFAPASVVAPLGTVRRISGVYPGDAHADQQFALVANCFFAPLILHERFRKVR
jgi:hypothetical protein